MRLGLDLLDSLERSLLDFRLVASVAGCRSSSSSLGSREILDRNQVAQQGEGQIGVK